MENDPDPTNKYLDNLHHGAKQRTCRFAKELRSRTTEAEQMLWGLLRNRKLKGKKFRRQHPIANYVADFYCHESKLVIELDGNLHKGAEVKKYDKQRTAELNDLGLTVLRFWNEEVIKHPEEVLQKIAEHLC